MLAAGSRAGLANAVERGRETDRADSHVHIDTVRVLPTGHVDLRLYWRDRPRKRKAKEREY